MQKKTENITNGIWIKLIRKTNQCVFDFDTIWTHISFFLLTFHFFFGDTLCYFYVSFGSLVYTRKPIHTGLLFFVQISLNSGSQSVSRRSVWLWLCVIVKLLFYGYMLPLKRIYTTLQNIYTFNILKEIFEKWFSFMRKIFPRRRRKCDENLLRWFKFRCDDSNIKIFWFSLEPKRKYLILMVI